MKTYSGIKAEIARLEKEAERIKRSEVAGVIERIKQAIGAYGLTAADLGLAPGAPQKRNAGKTAGTRTGTTVGVAKYRDPATGKTWTGRGRPPDWIVGAKDRDRFLVAVTAGAALQKRPKQPGKGRRAAGKTTRAARKTTAPQKSATSASDSAAASP
jgi:DNA-binding protein H-NS